MKTPVRDCLVKKLLKKTEYSKSYNIFTCKSLNLIPDPLSLETNVENKQGRDECIRS